MCIEEEKSRAAAEVLAMEEEDAAAKGFAESLQREAEAMLQEDSDVKNVPTVKKTIFLTHWLV